MSPEISWWGVAIALVWVASLVFAYFLGKTVGIEDAWKRSSAALRREFAQAEALRRDSRWQKWTD